MFSKIKKYLKDRNDSISSRFIPNKQIFKLMQKHFKSVGNFGTATLILVDIDNFRNLKEVYGEEIGDKIITEVSKHLIALIPSEASISLLNTDGFLIFIPDEGLQSRVEKLCKKMLEAVKSSSNTEDLQHLSLSASIGVCTYPQSGSTVKELLEGVNLTTAVSKRSGGNKVTSYYATLSNDERSNMVQYEEIRTAIQKKEFILYYLPIIDITNQKLFGTEALTRWNHPTKGILPPKEFMQLLEQTGDIHWVGRWGMDRMVRFQQSLNIKYPELHLVFSLNLSLKQLLNPDLAVDFIEIIKQLNAKPSRIMLEITDFMVYKNMKVIEANITKLKAFGFRIAADCFPLNPQSVLAIQNSPIDVIKLSKDFLKDITNNFSQEKLLENLIEYCKKNNKMIICDGIETKDLLQYVKSQNLEFGSGFYFAKALDIPSLMKYIEEEKWKEQLVCDE